MLKRWLIVISLVIICATNARIDATQHVPTPPPQSPNDDRDSQKPTSVVVQIGTQQPDAPETKEKDETDRELARYTFWLAVLTGVLVVVSGIQGYFLFRQAGHLETHGTELRNLAGAASDNARAAHDTAQATLKHAEHIVASERAWILIGRVIFSSGASDRPEGNKQVFIQCAAKNHGRTPARVLGLNAIYAPGPISDPGQTWDDKLYISNDQSTPRWVILPDKASALHCPIPGFFAERGQAIREALKEGEAYFIHGVVRYWDTFSETERYTRFCCRWHNDNETPGLDAGFHFAGGDRYNQQT
jgi:hypothetical protein